jgi:hypothetical protein
VMPLVGTYDFLVQAAQGDLDKALFRAAAKAFGGLLHIPGTGQAANTVEGALHIMDGYTRDPGEAAQALIVGPPR